MDEILFGLEKVRLSAFRKYSQLTGDINNITIGPNKSPKKEEENISKHTKKTKKKTHHRAHSGDRTPDKTIALQQLVQELEQQRQQKVQEAINNRYQKFVEFTKCQKRDHALQLQARQQALLHEMQEKEKAILQTLNQYDRQTMDKNEKLVKHYQVTF